MEKTKKGQSGRYEKLYEELVGYERALHEKNQRRIKIGLKLIWIIPLIFLMLLFVTNSSKIVFLVLWIVSLFLIAGYLILVEYADYKLQEKLNEMDDAEAASVDSLIGNELLDIERPLTKVGKKVSEIMDRDYYEDDDDRQEGRYEEHI